MAKGWVPEFLGVSSGFAMWWLNGLGQSLILTSIFFSTYKIPVSSSPPSPRVTGIFKYMHECGETNFRNIHKKYGLGGKVKIKGRKEQITRTYLFFTLPYSSLLKTEITSIPPVHLSFSISMQHSTELSRLWL